MENPERERRRHVRAGHALSGSPPLSSIGGLKIHATDFNADGKPDLSLTWGGASAGLATLRNSTGLTPPPAPSAPTPVSPANRRDSRTARGPWIGTTSPMPRATRSRLTTPRRLRRPSWRTPRCRFPGHAQRVAQQRPCGGACAPAIPPACSAPFPLDEAIHAAGRAGASGAISWVSVNPSSVTGGVVPNGTVTLTSARRVAVRWSPCRAATRRSSACRPRCHGACRIDEPNLRVVDLRGWSDTPVTITAVYGGITRTTTLTVNPPDRRPH